MKTNGFLGAAALMLVSTLFFAFKPILVRMALERGLSPEELMVLRLSVAFPLFVLTIAALGRVAEAKMNARELAVIAVVSIAGMGGAMLFSFYSILHLGASVSTLLIFVFPAITTLMAYFVNRRPITTMKVVSLVTSFAGIVLVVIPLSGSDVPGQSLPLVGIGYAMITALCWAGTQVAIENLTHKKSPLVVAAYTSGFILFFYATLNGMPPLDLDGETWALVVILGTFVWYVPFLMAIYAIKLIGASNSAIIQSLGPGLTVLIAWAMLGETLAYVQVIGMLMLIAAVYMLKNEPRVVAGQPEQVPAVVPDAEPRTQKTIRP